MQINKIVDELRRYAKLYGEVADTLAGSADVIVAKAVPFLEKPKPPRNVRRSERAPIAQKKNGKDADAA